jgi:sugar lactone lactonase YvrE/enterochelin esterase-like enzyme
MIRLSLAGAKPPRLLPFLALLAVVAGGALPARAQDAAPATPPPAATAPAVPKGEVLRFTFENSKVFPGTFRDYWVYVPAQYSPDKPACVYVNQDGIQWRAPQVFDDLIARKEMPVTIGVFVMHGRVKAADGKTALDRFNRSYEYDGLGDDYARFILDELLPEVETKKTADGRAIRLSRDGNDRAIGGSSSGAVCAFTAAWERPDAFRRVFSAIGTYVGLRGADRYPTLIRKTEPKPLRVFLQDGSNDLNIYGGDWWMANQMMERALTFAGYDVRHVWGEGGHNGQQGTEVFPDAMRWLWRDWPAPVKAAGENRNGMLRAIVDGGAAWEPDALSAAGRPAAALTSSPSGVVSLTVMSLTATTRPGAGRGLRRLVAGARVTTNNGNTYAAEARGDRDEPGRLWLIRKGGKTTELDSAGLGDATGLTLSPDQTLLYAAEGGSHWVWSYQIQPDGTLKHGQRYFWMHSPDDADDSGAAGMAVDREGRLYVATRMGVQVCDQAGRVNVILPLPENRSATGLTFGGEKFDTLYVASGNRVYRRRMKTVGAPAFAAPLRPAPPGL